jgi:BlaI family transcriptional regulator, penicillinase repressor
LFERLPEEVVKTQEAAANHEPLMPEEKNRSSRRRRAPVLPQISDAEWVVMRVVWQKAPATANEVVEALRGEAEWKPKTIHTLLARLVRKQALRFEKLGREYLFHPCVTAEECEHAVTRSFLDRFFGGELAPLLARFVEKEKLTSAEIERLKRILDRQNP